jgi:hypothetical protein
MINTQNQSGSNNVQIALDGIVNSQVHFHSQAPSARPVALIRYERINEKRLPLTSDHLSIAAQVCTVLGALPPILSYSFEPLKEASEFSRPFFYLAAVGIIAWGTRIAFTKGKFMCFSKTCFQLKEDGHIHQFSAQGKCPICSGKVALKDIKGEGPRGLCQNNPSHKFSYDFTIDQGWPV